MLAGGRQFVLCLSCFVIIQVLADGSLPDSSLVLASPVASLLVPMTGAEAVMLSRPLLPAMQELHIAV